MGKKKRTIELVAFNGRLRGVIDGTAFSLASRDRFELPFLRGSKAGIAIFERSIESTSDKIVFELTEIKDMEKVAGTENTYKPSILSLAERNE